MERASEFLPRPLKDMKIAYINTASKGVEDLSYLERHKKAQKDLGWNLEEMDIAGKKQDEVRRMLAGKDVIYVEGGNAFYLMKAIRESVFKDVLEDLLGEGVVYVGTSAGSYVTCPSNKLPRGKTPRY